jgi:TPP-dependent pyruvate/acetoin dehydrogenase alpha subunit
MYNSRPVNEALGKDPFHPGVPLGAFLTTVAEFEIEYHQFLDAEGKLREPAPALAHDSAELIKMYRLMTLVRAFDTKAGALTYRLSDHTTADDASRYRPAGPLDAAWKKEPLHRIRTLLTKTGAWDERQENELQADCARQIEAAVDHYLSAPKPTTDAMFDSVFARPTRSLLEQREMVRRCANKHGR